jgi:lipopolysaccharide exporter
VVLPREGRHLHSLSRSGIRRTTGGLRDSQVLSVEYLMTARPAWVAARARVPTSKSQNRAGSLSRKVRNAAAWSMGSTIFFKLIGITATAIVAHILTRQDFGLFAVATTVYTIVSALGGSSLTTSLTRADLEVSDIAPTMWTFSLGTNVLVAGALVFFAQPIAAGLGSPNGAGPVRIMAIVAILDGLTGVPTALLIRDFKQSRIFIAGLVSFIPSTAALVFLAKSGDGAMAFAWSRVIGTAIVCIIILISVRKHYMPWISRSGLSVLYHFAVPFTLATLVGYLLQNVDYVLIGRVMGPVMLGTYVLAFNAASWSSSLLGGALGAVGVSAFSRVRYDRERLMVAIADGVRAVVLIAAPMSVLEMVLSRPLVLLLYGQRWATASTPLAILTLYGIISIVCLLFSQMLAALGQSKFILVVQLLWLGALLPAMALGVHADGIVGAACAHIIIIVPIVLPCYLIALKRATGVPIGSVAKAALPALVAAVIAGAIAWLLEQSFSSPVAKLFVGGGVGGLFYLTATAPQLILLIDRGKIHHPKVLRFMRIYYRVGRGLGLRVGPSPRHAKRDNFTDSEIQGGNAANLKTEFPTSPWSFGPSVAAAYGAAPHGRQLAPAVECVARGACWALRAVTSDRG